MSPATVQNNESRLYAEDSFDWDEYEQYRPRYPQRLYDIIFDFHASKSSQPQWTTAVDLGCGPGNVTSVLASRFESAVGSDISEPQLKHGAKVCKTLGINNVTFKVSSGEELDWIETGSVDLVTVAEAIHWMDDSKVMKQITRILRPGSGTVAILHYAPAGILLDVPKDLSDFTERTMAYKLLRATDTLRINAPAKFEHLLKASSVNWMQIPIAKTGLLKNETRLNWKIPSVIQVWSDALDTVGYKLSPIENNAPESEGYAVIDHDIHEDALLSRFFEGADMIKYARSIGGQVADDDADIAKIRRGIEELPEKRAKFVWPAHIVLGTRTEEPFQA